MLNARIAGIRKLLTRSSVVAAGFVLLTSLAAFGQEPIKIGISMSVTGRFERPAGYLFEGHKLWEKHVNQRGGIQGRPVKLVFYDDKSDPAEAIKLTRRLATVDRVDFLFSPYGSELTAAVASVIEELGVPAIASIVATVGPWQGKNAKWMTQFSSTAPLYLMGSVDLAIERAEAKNIAILYEDTPFPVGVADGLRARAKERGLKILMDEKYDKALTDWSPLVSKARSLGAEFLAGGGYYPAAVGIARAAAGIGYRLKLLALVVGAADPKFVKDLGLLAEGVAGSDIWLPSVKTRGFVVEGATIANEDFVRSYREEFKRDPEYWSAAGYGAGQLLGRAINESLKRARKADRNLIRDFLFSYLGETIYGDYGVVKLGQADAGMQVRKQHFVIQWQKGKKEVVWPRELASAEPWIGWPK